MSKHLLGKIILGAFAAFILLYLNGERPVFAETITGSMGISGLSEVLDDYYSNESDTEKIPFLLSVKNNFPDNVATVNTEKVSSVLNIRSKAGTGNSKVGLLAPNAAVIVNSIENGWAQVESGEVKGYVSTDYLITGEDGLKTANEVKSLYATVNKKITSLNVRQEPNTSSDIILKVKAGEMLVVSNPLVVNKEEPDNKLWVEVVIDSDTNDTEKTGYVALDYVTVNYELQWAVKYTPYGADVSDARVAICDEAMKYLGTKYVWGGNDPWKGIDCSGLVNYVFKHVSYTKNLKSVINMPRVSNDMYKSTLYKHITRSELKPGDLVFYANNTKVYHVAIYIGNGRIVHSSTNYKGVAVSSMDFISPKHMYYARVLND